MLWRVAKLCLVKMINMVATSCQWRVQSVFTLITECTLQAYQWGVRKFSQALQHLGPPPRLKNVFAICLVAKLII